MDTSELQGHVINDRYRVLELIGKGGSGQIYRAEDVSSGSQIALKVLRGVGAEDPDSVIRFEKEVAASARLVNPHAVKVYEFGKTKEGYLVIAMEFLDGRPLTRIIRDESPLPASRAVRIIKQTLEVLAEAHREGIVHRDLKPDNIFIVNHQTKQDFVKVLDFGIAKFLLEDIGRDTLSRDGFFFGTPLYISPEQALGWQVTASSDIYSLGVVLFEMLAGFPPFEAETPIGLGMKHIYEPPPLDRLVARNDSGDSLKHLLSLMLEKRPEQRPANGGAALALFNALPEVPDDAFWLPSDASDSRVLEKDSPTVRVRLPTVADMNISHYVERVEHTLPTVEPERKAVAGEDAETEHVVVSTGVESRLDEERDVMGEKSRKGKGKKKRRTKRHDSVPPVQKGTGRTDSSVTPRQETPAEVAKSQETPVEQAETPSRDSPFRGDIVFDSEPEAWEEHEALGDEEESRFLLWGDEQRSEKEVAHLPGDRPVTQNPQEARNETEPRHVFQRERRRESFRRTRDMTRPALGERRDAQPQPVERPSTPPSLEDFYLIATEGGNSIASKISDYAEDEYEPRGRKDEQRVGIVAWLVFFLGLALAGFLLYIVFLHDAKAGEDPLWVGTLQPIHDTYATHDDKTVHGFEPIIRVGIEPQQCVEGGWNPCPEKDPPQVCCPPGPEGYSYCAPEGQCGSVEPSWDTFRKYRGYIRFTLSQVPAGKVVNANLRLTEVNKVQGMGDPNLNIHIYALKSIGLGKNQTCEWFEQTLNSTDGTTWNTLPQNVSITPDGAWNWDVTKAVADWLTGNTDLPGSPVMPNCGFHLEDVAYGTTDGPIQRWVDFSSKEGIFPPQLKIIIARDLDGDGYFGDCDEENPEIHPDAVELCDGTDNDCDGLTDEENCDGLDNDCDGLIDEGEDLCGEGMTCLCNQCVVTCKDECGSPFALKCEMGADGIWERWGCKKDADPDPCYDWYFVEKCKPEQYCQFGWCADNCIDICDVEGEKSCQKDSTGKWYIAECNDYDMDGCLEWGNFQYCGDGSVCHQLKCGPTTKLQCEILKQGGCVDMCLTGEKSCMVLDGVNHVVECLPDPVTSCLVWQPVEACTKPGATQCERKGFDAAHCTGSSFCIPECNESILGKQICYRDSAGHWTVGKCGDLDNDGCLEFDPVEKCEVGGGCVDGKCTPGCSAACDVPGEAQCVDGETTSAVLCCMDLANDGIAEWNVIDLCELGACVDGKCTAPAPTCTDECSPEGATSCVADESGAVVLVCVPDKDEDECLEWAVSEVCDTPYCSEDQTACAPPGTVEPDEVEAPGPEAAAEPQPDVTTTPESVLEVVEQPSQDLVFHDLPSDLQTDAGVIDLPSSTDIEPSPPEKSDTGCSCRIAGSTGDSSRCAILLLLSLSAALLFALRFRRNRAVTWR